MRTPLAASEVGAAAEVELANTRLDVEDTSASTRAPSEGDGRHAPAAASSDTASYFQVVVEKHTSKRARGRGRVPVASSPKLDAKVAAKSPPLLLACYKCGAEGRAGLAFPPGAGDWRPRPEHGAGEFVRTIQEEASRNTWRGAAGESLREEGPDRVEVYHFERGSNEYLRTGGGAREAACERAARAPARLLGAVLDEALAGAAMVARIPLVVVLRVQRATLAVARDAAAGCAHTASDYALKPALALVFNALAHPLLVFAANAARGMREAAAPLAGLLLDLVEPVARLLAAARLVEVHVHPRVCTRPHE